MEYAKYAKHPEVVAFEFSRHGLRRKKRLIVVGLEKKKTVTTTTHRRRSQNPVNAHST
jgi:hypothetical protein